MKRFLCLTLLLTAATALRAEPQYSALFGQSCYLCHAGATGRGMRSLYGSQFFGATYLPFKPVSFELLEKVKPKLSESVSIGADLRTIWMSENTQDNNAQAGLSAPLSTNTGTISQMEGYLYFALQPTEEVLIYYSQGIAQASGRFEAYGQANVLPWHGFVKAGQFQENYGWAFADHTSFVRTGLLMDYSGTEASVPNPPHYGVGAELGFHPKFFDLTASYTNASSTIPGARDSQKRWFARASAQHGIESLGLQFCAGGSWFLAPRKYADPEYGFFLPEQKRYEGWGGFGGIGWQGLQDKLGCHGGFGFLTTSLLFEYDRKAWTDTDSLLAVTAAYSTTQASVMVQPGVWLTGAYDWMDTGWRDIPGYEDPQAERTTLGLQVFPLPWIEISPRYRLYSLAGLTQRNKQMMEVQAHFFF